MDNVMGLKKETGGNTMDFMTVSWIICGAVWGLLILALVVLRIVNKIRGRGFRDDSGSGE